MFLLDKEQHCLDVDLCLTIGLLVVFRVNQLRFVDLAIVYTQPTRTKVRDH
jgi:hypothetical protein